MLVSVLGGRQPSLAPLLRELGKFVEKISGHVDPAFEQNISRFTTGIEAVIVLGECPLRSACAGQ